MNKTPPKGYAVRWHQCGNTPLIGPGGPHLTHYAAILAEITRCRTQQYRASLDFLDALHNIERLRDLVAKLELEWPEHAIPPVSDDDPA
jgi:hypothetical protein